MDSMLRRLFAGFGLSAGIVVVTMVAQVVSVPVLLTHWGAITYGEWLVLTNLASSLSIMNLGVQSYVCNLLISSYVKGEIENWTRLLHSALLLYILFTGVAVLVVFIFALSPGLLVWMKVEQIPALDGHIILVIFGSMATYAISGGLLLSLFQVTKQMPRQLMYGLMERTIIMYSPMIVAFLGGQPVAAAIAMVISMCCLIVVELRDVWIHSPFPIGLSQADWSLSLSFIRPGLTFFSVSLAGLMVSTGITLLIANQAGGKFVAIFSTTLLLGNLVRTLINQGMNVLWPEITGMAALKDDTGRLSRWYLLLLKLVSAFVLICMLGICALGGDILMIWTRGRIEVSPVLNLLLAIYLVVQAPILVGAAFGLALNRQADLLKTQFVAGCITLSLGVLFIHQYGLNGAAFALIAGQASIVLWLSKMVCNWIEAAWGSFLLKTFSRLILVTIPVMVSSIALIASPFGLSSKAFCVAGLTGAIVFICWVYWLMPEEKKLLRSTVLALIQRRY